MQITRRVLTLLFQQAVNVGSIMTSVNSPASLLARNHFYRSLPSSPGVMNAPYSCQNNSAMHEQNQVTLWISMGVPPALQVAMGTKGLSMEIVLGPSSPPKTKPPNPGDQHVK
ncbi:hypothetical protein ILYODFUR_019154 [Ilyodon furcidens]|uniref:Uncharacterized protein n=1 Tax=Ilyodon furcidens TaxID=33524 RepID=A0ABV0T9H9_9TELE